MHRIDPPNSGAAREILEARLHIGDSGSGDFPPELSVRLTLRGGLIADIRELDPPATIELLYFDGCPHYETFLPHLRALLATHDIDAPITLIRVENDEDARTTRFLGSPSLRVNGRDVDPTTGQRDTDDHYGLQCHLYATAIHTGDLPTLARLLTDHPGLANTRLGRHQGRTLLHVATDWPGHYPNVAATITALIAAGADPNAPGPGEHPETRCTGRQQRRPARDQCAARQRRRHQGTRSRHRRGTPMADATAFGEWDAARLLLNRGAHTNLFEAAALGLVPRVQAHLDAAATSDNVTSSFWGACHGGHIETAAVLLDHGADLNWVGYDELTPLDAAARSGATSLIHWLEHRGAKTAPPGLTFESG